MEEIKDISTQVPSSFRLRTHHIQETGLEEIDRMMSRLDTGFSEDDDDDDDIERGEFEAECEVVDATRRASSYGHNNTLYRPHAHTSGQRNDMYAAGHIVVDDDGEDGDVDDDMASAKIRRRSENDEEEMMMPQRPVKHRHMNTNDDEDSVDSSSVPRLQVQPSAQ